MEMHNTLPLHTIKTHSVRGSRRFAHAPQSGFASKLRVCMRGRQHTTFHRSKL